MQRKYNVSSHFVYLNILSFALNEQSIPTFKQEQNVSQLF